MSASLGLNITVPNAIGDPTNLGIVMPTNQPPVYLHAFGGEPNVAAIGKKPCVGWRRRRRGHRHADDRHRLRYLRRRLF